MSQDDKRSALTVADETLSKAIAWIGGFICSGPGQEERKAGMVEECRQALALIRATPSADRLPEPCEKCGLTFVQRCTQDGCPRPHGTASSALPSMGSTAALPESDADAKRFLDGLLCKPVDGVTYAEVHRLLWLALSLQEQRTLGRKEPAAGAALPAASNGTGDITGGN